MIARGVIIRFEQSSTRWGFQEVGSSGGLAVFSPTMTSNYIKIHRAQLNDRPIVIRVVSEAFVR